MRREMKKPASRESANSEVVGSQRCRHQANSGAAGALALAAQAVGACALGALAIGALAVGRLAIRRMAIGRGAVRSLAIEDLSVTRLCVGGQAMPDAITIADETQRRDGLVSLRSRYSVDETVSRLQVMLGERGVTLFALIDHSGEAEKVGLQMRPTRLLIFGSPNAGTPLMVAVPTIAIDLPLKLLVWEDVAGKVWISFNSAEYLRNRHHLPQELVENIALVSALAKEAAE